MIKDGSFDKTIIYDDFSFKIEEYMKFCPNEDVELLKRILTGVSENHPMLHLKCA